MGTTYCENADIIAEFKDLKVASDAILTTGKIDDMRDQAYAYINARVGRKYATPIVATASLPIVQMIETYLVAHRIKRILPVKTGQDKSSQGDPSFSDYRKDAEAMLEKIEKGTMPLDGAVLRKSGDGVQSYTSSTTADERTFKRDRDQW